MLQQTQVSTVEPYFEAFLRSFPTVEDLAAAPIDKVLAHWSGLGYYRRARLLHAAAQKLTEEKRNVPTSADQLLELPGIGPYTAAAIASIAFGERVAVLDGNVERVITRLLAYEENPKTSAGKKFLTREALKLVSEKRPGDSNQALMELGATVCRPKAPACLFCPLEGICRGRFNPEAFPKAQAKKKAQRVDISVAVVEREGKTLLFKRPESSDLLAGLWELPHVVHPPNQAVDLETIAGKLGEAYGGGWTLEPAKQTVKHSITHRAITFHVHRGSLSRQASEIRQRSYESAWVGQDERGSYATSSAVTKILTSISDRKA